MWELWKQSFGAWDKATSQYMDQVLVNPAVLEPAAALVTAVMKTKSAADRLLASCWSVLGLPTRNAQDQALHKLNQLESRLLDLEEQLHKAGASR